MKKTVVAIAMWMMLAAGVSAEDRLTVSVQIEDIDSGTATVSMNGKPVSDGPVIGGIFSFTVPAGSTGEITVDVSGSAGFKTEEPTREIPTLKGLSAAIYTLQTLAGAR